MARTIDVRHKPRTALHDGSAARACVFVGPSLAGCALPAGIAALPPATRGALAAAVRSGYRRIGLIDGAIDASERLPLRELREALALPGVTLLGGASMGAVRAAQLHALGMKGIGRIFRLFRCGGLARADEVYVLYAPSALRYRCLTLPLVNIRYTLRDMRRAGHLTRDEATTLCLHMQHVPWFDRDRHSLSGAVYRVCGAARTRPVMRHFDAMYRDVKQEDALALVSRLSRQA